MKINCINGSNYSSLLVYILFATAVPLTKVTVHIPAPASEFGNVTGFGQGMLTDVMHVETQQSKFLCLSHHIDLVP
jgi:hypothetical protein